MRIPTKELLAALETMRAVVPARPPKPILRDVLFDRDGRLTVTDLYRTLSAKVPMVVDGVPAAIPHAELLTFVRGVTGFEVSFEALELHQWRVTAGGDFATLEGHDPNNFPIASAEPDTYRVVLAGEFVQEVKRCAEFASRDQTRYQLGGVFVEYHNQTVALGATDGKILCQSKMRADLGACPPFSFILPNGACAALAKIFKGEVSIEVAAGGDYEYQEWDDAKNKNVTKRRGPAWARFSSDRGLFFEARAVEGRFPNYRNALHWTDKPKAAWTVDRKKLLAECKKMTKVADEREQYTCIFRVEEAVLRITTKSWSVSLPIERTGGTEAVEIRLNPRYLQTLLETSKEKTFPMFLKTEDRPVWTRSEGWVALVMPLVLERAA